MTARGTESMAWDGIVVQCGEVHVETSASWAGPRDLKGCELLKTWWVLVLMVVESQGL